MHNWNKGKKSVKKLKEYKVVWATCWSSIQSLSLLKSPGNCWCKWQPRLLKKSLLLSCSLFFFFSCSPVYWFCSSDKVIFSYSLIQSITVWYCVNPFFFFFPKGLATGETAGWKQSIIPQELQFFFLWGNSGSLIHPSYKAWELDQSLLSSSPYAWIFSTQ